MRRERRNVGLVGLAAALALGLGLAAPMAGAQPPSQAPEGAADGVVEGSWIVTLQPGQNPKAEAARLSAQHGGQANHVYEHALSGFSFEGSAQAAAALARNRKVRSVIADRVVATADQVLPTGISRIDGPLSGTLAGNGWGAVDVDVAVIDTGIDLSHPDLNVVGGRNCSNGSSSNYGDGNGHGTHVAGTIGAKDDGIGVVGVAPGARLWAVRVLDNRGSGTWSSVICGVDWVTGKAADIEVANMSLGGSGAEGHCNDSGLHEAICNSVGAGVTYAVAAGNNAWNAANDVPASYDEVITVSALADFNGLPGGGGPSTCRADVDDTLADFSNFGADVDLIAPGVCILSTYTGGGYATISGTSMASPHVAGAAALYASDHATASPAQIKAALEAAGNDGWNDVGDPDGVKEPLLDVGTFVGTTLGDGGGDPDPATNEVPVAGFDPTCVELACTFVDTSTDTDGAIVSWEWDFGDGSAGSSSASPEHGFAANGSYLVQLTVTDDVGATDTTSQTITVAATPPPPPSGFTLTATGYKVKGVQHADLVWSGATSANVDIRRDGALVATTANDGAYTDNIRKNGNGTYSYRVCEAGTDTCSGVATISFS